MREQKTKAQVKKPQQILDNTHPMSTHWHSHINQLPPHIPFPIIYNNNTMDIEFLQQMRKCNKSGIVSNDEIFNLHLGSGARVWVSIPCLLQDISHIYWFHLPKQSTRKKQRTQKWDSTPNKLYRTGLAYVHRIQS